jgi:hypothetical protein
MKLTEAKLKQMIKEAMKTTPLPHLDKITDLFATSLEDGNQAASFVDNLVEYELRKPPIFRSTPQSSMISLRFKYASQAKEFYESLNPKLKNGITAYLTTIGSRGMVNIHYPNKDFFKI